MFGKKVDTRKLNETLDLSSKVLRILYLLLITLALYVGLMIFKETKILHFIIVILKVVFPLFIGLVIAWLFNPFVRWLESKKVKRIFGVVFTYLLIFFVLYLTLSALIPVLIEQVLEMVRMSPSIINTVRGWSLEVFSHLERYDVSLVSQIKANFFSMFENVAIDITTNIPSNLFNFISKFFSFLGTFILGLIIGFFLLTNFDNSSKLFNFIPSRHKDITLKLIGEINVSLRNYVRGAVIDAGLIFVLSSIGFWIVGLKAPALFGLFCGLTNVIPYAGPYIGGAPALLVGFTQSPVIGSLTFLVIFVIQFLEGNFLQPVIMSKTTKLHPVTILLGLLVFGHFWGIIGMLISTPLIASVKTIFMFYNERYELIKREEEDHE